MRGMVEKIMVGQGQEIGLEQEGVVANCHGFFQPVHGTSLQQLKLDVGDLGRVPGGTYEIMVASHVEFEVGTRACVHGIWYVVRAMEVIYGGDEPVYRWGLLVKEGAVDGDIS